MQFIFENMFVIVGIFFVLIWHCFVFKIFDWVFSPPKAHQTLDALKTISNIEISDERLIASNNYLDVAAGGEKASMHGQFTAKELEAIAHWMKQSERRANDKTKP